MSVNTEKVLDKIQHSQESRVTGKFPQLDKDHLQNPIATIIFN